MRFDSALLHQEMMLFEVTAKKGMATSAAVYTKLLLRKGYFIILAVKAAKNFVSKNSTITVFLAHSLY